MDAEVLSAAAVAEILQQDPAEIAALFASGELPGRRINGRWYTTRRQLLAYIESGASPPEPASDPPPVSRECVPRGMLDNAWECARCETLNGPERVECAECGAARATPLINYFPFS